MGCLDHQSRALGMGLDSWGFQTWILRFATMFAWKLTEPKTYCPLHGGEFDGDASLSKKNMVEKVKDRNNSTNPS